MLFLKAVLIGLAIAAPLGPIGALCIRRVLSHGFAAGVAGGLGTALADATYAAAAALGFAAFAAILARLDLPLSMLGGGLLLWLGWRCWPRGRGDAGAKMGSGAALDGAERGPAPRATSAPRAGASLIRTVLLTYGLTIANPATILSFAAIFAGLGLAGRSDPGSVLAVVAGVFAGSMLWWVALCAAVSLLHQRLSAGFERRVAQGSSLVMAGFGLWALARGLALLSAAMMTGRG